MGGRPYGQWKIEPKGDGFIFYGGLFSRGIRISRAEAEIWLSGDEAAWSDIIQGRTPTEPPRPYWPALQSRLASLPRGYHFLLVMVGLSFVAQAIRASSLLGGVIQGVGGAVAIGFGCLGLWLLWSRRA